MFENAKSMYKSSGIGEIGANLVSAATSKGSYKERAMRVGSVGKKAVCQSHIKENQKLKKELKTCK